jgi:hypothetical protein
MMTPKQERNGIPGPTATHTTADPVVPSFEPEIAAALASASRTGRYQSATVTIGTVGQ